MVPLAGNISGICGRLNSLLGFFMKAYTDSVARLIEQFCKLPGIGERSAERLALYVLKTPKDEAMELAFAIRDVKKNIRHCKTCFNLAEGDLCPVCSGKKRDTSLLCVVEFPRDLMAIEETGEYNGLYHVLLGTISPINDMSPEDIKSAELIQRVAKGDFKEVILFTNPTVEGDLTAGYIAEKLAGLDVKVTRMARGVPSGTELEFISKGVIADALNGRGAFSGKS